MTVNQRDAFFDSLKFVLIFLVVLGHAIEVLLFRGESGRFLKETYTLIYTFHMPLFIFISGYFSKNASFRKFPKWAMNLMIPYFIFQFILSLPNILDGKFDFTQFILLPQNGMWYILSLICWRFVACVINRQNWIGASSTLVLSIMLAFFVGFTPLSTPVLSVSRTIVFLPFFLLGFYCNPELIVKIRGINKIYTSAILIGVSALIICFLSTRPAYQYTLWGFMPYKEFSSSIVGVGFRSVAFVLAIAMSFSVINLCSSRFGKYGSSTLGIYLLHMPLIYIGFDHLIGFLNMPVGLLGSILATIVTVVACILLSRVKLIKFIISPIK